MIFFLPILLLLASCNSHKTAVGSAELRFTYQGTVYELSSMNGLQARESTFEISGIELTTTSYEVADGFGVRVVNKPAEWTAEEAIDNWQADVIKTWRNNSIGTRVLEEDCRFPCKDLVFTFAIAGLYYYARVYVVNNQIIEMMAIYDDPNTYQEFRKVYDSFGN